jgi:hypothetical protein
VAADFMAFLPGYGFQRRAARGLCAINRENEPTFRAAVRRGGAPFAAGMDEAKCGIAP